MLSVAVKVNRCAFIALGVHLDLFCMFSLCMFSPFASMPFLAMTNALWSCGTLLMGTIVVARSWWSGRLRFSLRLRDHLHCPDRSRTHVHRGPEIPIHIPRFRCAEPISFAVVDHVVQTPRRAVAF